MVLPLLGGLLLYQYTVLIGFPPGLPWSMLRHLLGSEHPAVLSVSGHGARHHSRPPDAPSTAILLKVIIVSLRCWPQMTLDVVYWQFVGLL